MTDDLFAPQPEDIEAFCLAARVGDFQNLQRLLNVHGPAILNLRDSIAATPITWAAATGQRDIVTWLLEQGANIECQGTDDRTALGYAATGRHTDIVLDLLNKGASLEAYDRFGNDVLKLTDNSGLSDVRAVIATWQAEQNRKKEAEAALAARAEAQARREELKKQQPHKSTLKKNKPAP